MASMTDLAMALNKYGWHLQLCEAYWGLSIPPTATDTASLADDTSKPCTCGFRDELQEALEILDVRA